MGLAEGVLSLRDARWNCSSDEAVVACEDGKHTVDKMISTALTLSEILSLLFTTTQSSSSSGDVWDEIIS